jgi:hypothetical protein
MYYNEFDGSTNRRSINDTTKLNPVKKSITPIVYVKPINTQPFEYETPTRTSKYDNSMTNKTQFYKYRQDIVQFLQQTQPNVNLLNKSLTYEVYNYNDPEYLKQVEGARRNGLDAKSIALIYKPPKKMVYSTMKEAADTLTGLMGYLQKLTTTDAVQTAADKKVIKDLIDKTVREAQADEIKKNEDFLKEIRDKQTYDLIPTVRPIPTDSKLGEVFDVSGDFVFDDTRLNQFMVDNEKLLSSDNLKQYNIAYGLALYNLMKEYYIYYTLQGVYEENDIMNDLYNKMDNVVNPKLLQDTYMYIEKNQQLKYTNVDYDPFYTLSRDANKKIQNDFYKLMEAFITNITNKNNLYDVASSEEEDNKSVNLNPPGSDDEDLNAIGGPAVQPIGPQAPATPPAQPTPQPTPPATPPAQPTPQPTPPPTPPAGPQPAGPAQPDPLLLPPAQPDANNPPPLDENIFVTIPVIGRDRLERFKFNGSQYVSTIFDYKTDEKNHQQFLKGDQQRPPGTDNNTYRSYDGKDILCASCNTPWGRHKPTPENKDKAHSLSKKHPHLVLLRFMMLAGDTRYYDKSEPDKIILNEYPETKGPRVPTPIKDMKEQTRENLLNNYIQWFNTNVQTFAGQGMQDGQGVKVVYIQPKKNSTMKSNGWLKHVKEVSDRDKISWAEALKKAKLTYKK